MNKKTFIIIVSIVVVLAIIGIIVGIVVSKNKEDDKKGNAISAKVKVKLKTLCSNTNSKGNFYVVDTPDKYCESFVCYVKKDDYLYSLDCKEDRDKVKKEKIGNSKKSTKSANITLSTACSNVNSEGSYYDDYDDSLYCKDFMCHVVIDGKTYSRDCKA